MNFRLTGLVAATFTPMNGDGSLNLDRIAPMVDYLVDKGLNAVYVCGSTGEGPSMTNEERKETAAAFVSAAAGRLKVVVQVGHSCLGDARALAAHAQQIGADAVAAVAPYYFKPDSVDTLVDCLAEITAGAPQLPFYYYHIPALTGVEADLEAMLRLAAERIPTLVGIKYTATTMHEIQMLRALDGGRFDILHGRDEMLLSALAVGVRGAIGSTYNFAAPLYQRLMTAFDGGDLEEAQRCQARSVAMIREILGTGGQAGLKAAMNLLGFDCGPVRLPLRTLDAEQMSRLEQKLRRAGPFDRP